MMDMDLHERREASTTLALAAQKQDMKSAFSTSSFANPSLHIYALGVTSMLLHDLADKHSSLHSSFDIYPIFSEGDF